MKVSKPFKPFNMSLHLHCIAMGYTYDRFEASWEDAGDAENGPDLTGGPAFDMYTGPDEYIYVTEDGKTDRELRDLEMEKMEATMIELYADYRD